MKRLIPIAIFVVPALVLSACAGDYGYGYNTGLYSGAPLAYDGYYDGFYGPIHDGYWGDNDRFYFRRGPHERHFHRGGRRHFSRDLRPGGRFRHFNGSMRPWHGARTPHFPHGGFRGHHRHGRHH